MAQDFNAAVAQAVADGWTVTSQTESTASLTRKPKFKWGWFILWFILFFIIGGLIYWTYWTSKGVDTLFIELTDSGKLRFTRS